MKTGLRYRHRAFAVPGPQLNSVTSYMTSVRAPDRFDHAAHSQRFDNPRHGTDSISLIARTDVPMLPRQNPHLSVKEIDGQTIILDRPHGKLHELNATASYVWRCCDGRATIAEIAAATAREFSADPRTVGPDVDDILRQLEGLALIEWVNAPM